MEEELSKEAIRGAIKYDCVHSKMTLKQINTMYMFVQFTNGEIAQKLMTRKE